MQFNRILFLLLLLIISTIQTQQKSPSLLKDTISNNDNHFYKSSSLLYDNTLMIFKSQLFRNVSQSHSETTYTLFNVTQTTRITTSSFPSNSTYGLPDCMVPLIFTAESLGYETLIAYVQTDKDTLLENNPFTPNFYAFDFKTGNWNAEQQLSLNSPIRRSGATMAVTDMGILVFGGLVLGLESDGLVLTRQLYLFDKKLKLWRDISGASKANLVPPSAFHTMTLVNDQLIIIGGAKPSIKEVLGDLTDDGLDRFDSGTDVNPKGSNSLGVSQAMKKSNLEIVYIFDLKEQQWKVQKTTRFSVKPRIGHSATYLKKLNSILVYGGAAGLDKNDEVYNDVQILNLNNWEWFEPKIGFSDGSSPELGRAWHSAELVGDKLLFIYGDIHPYDPKYQRDILILDLCNLKQIQTSYYFVNKFGDYLNLNFQKDIEDGRNTDIFSANPNADALKDNPNNSPLLETPMIMGLTFGLIGGIILALILFFIIYKLRRRKLLRKKFKNNNNSTLSLLLPDNLLLPKFNDNALNPFKSTTIDTSNSIWDLDSNYAYSIYGDEQQLSKFNQTELTKRLSTNLSSSIHYQKKHNLFQSNSNLNFLPPKPTDLNLKQRLSNFNNNYNNNNNRNLDNTLIITRRWSSEFNSTPKVLHEVTPDHSLDGNTFFDNGNIEDRLPLLEKSNLSNNSDNSKRNHN